jgi:hypothetical protein
LYTSGGGISIDIAIQIVDEALSNNKPSSHPHPLSSGMVPNNVRFLLHLALVPEVRPANSRLILRLLKWMSP